MAHLRRALPGYRRGHSRRGSASVFEEVGTVQGKLLCLDVHKAPFLDEQGAIIGTVGSARDFTERKQAEEKLRLAASVFTYASEGIMITTADGTIIAINDAFSHITGYSRDEALGRNPRLLSSGRQDQAFYEALWRALIDNSHWSGEIWNRRKNGELFAAMQTISAVRDGQGRIRQYVALFSDISPLKEHQRRLEHIAHYDALTTLPNRVLLADRLRQAMAQAQRRGQQLAVAYLDLDGFKEVNDRHGHEAGDHLLIALAQRMKGVLREGDTLARLGGDEFVAVLVDLSAIEASVPTLNRLLAAAAEPVRVANIITRSRPVSASPSTRRRKRWMRINCCARPIRPCIRPSWPARIATISSTPSTIAASAVITKTWNVFAAPWPRVNSCSITSLR